MSRFKVGDLVTPISVKPYSDRIQRRLLGKTLVIYSFQDNGNSFLVFAGVIGDCGFFWHPDDLRLVSETQAEPAPEPAPDVPAPERAAPEPAPEAQMPERSKLRTVNWGGCGFLKPATSPTEPTDPAPAAVAEVPEPLVWVDGATHYQPHQDAFYKRVSAHEWYVWSRIVEREPLHWCKAPGTSDRAEWVVRNQPTDPAPAASKKPIRRGDLVVSNGDIYVVIETNHADGGYWIHAMTGKRGQDYAPAKDLTRIGSIRKKVKRIKKEMEGGK